MHKRHSVIIITNSYKCHLWFFFLKNKLYAFEEYIKLIYTSSLVYTEFILVQMCRKLLAYRNTLQSLPGTNQYIAMSAKFLAQGNNDLSQSGFELVWCVKHSTTPPP